jgi:4-amino-4-deoxy-L-arabinose transferase-like glycosyltransferase
VSLTVRIFRSDQSCLLLVLPLALFLTSFDLGGRDLWAPDEPRTGEVVREILLGGSWAVLHDNGKPYVEKPPLYFWLAAAASRAAGGVSETALRLPASLAALLGAIVLFYLGRDLFGRRVGALAAIVLVTTQKYFMEARWAHPDMLWTLLLTFACFAFYRGYRAGGDFRWLAAHSIAIGLALITKGPLGFLLPLAAVLVFLAASRDLGFVRRARFAWGLPLALLPTALWLASYRASSGEAFPLADTGARLLARFTQGVHHPRPLTHILTSLPIDLLPWVLFLPGALWHTFPRRGGHADRENVYLYSWITVILAVFTLSAEKRGVYLLPLLPLVALVIGRLWDTALFDWDPSPVDRTITWSLGAGLVLWAGSAAVFLPRIVREISYLQRPAFLLAGAALLAVAGAAVTHRLRGGGPALAVFVAGLVACYVVVAVGILPALDRTKSARPFCARVVAEVGAAPLGIYPDYHAAYVFYTRRFIEILPDRASLERFLRPDRRAFVLIESERYEAERRPLGLDLHVVDRERVGHRAMVLVSSSPNASPGAADRGGKQP